MKNHPENNFENEDLEKSAPLLYQLKDRIGSDAGFQVPGGYFDSLSAEVMKKIESLPDFEATASDNHFKTPEGYFDSLPTIIRQRIIDQNKKRKTVADRIGEIFPGPVPKYALAFVAVFLMVFFSIKYFTRTVKVEYVNDAPETEQLESFYISQLDETVLTEAYTEDHVTTDEAGDNGIENYLIENNIDLNLISEHL